MICHSCQVAGQANQEANRRAFDPDEVAEAMRSMTREWHSKCNYRDCPCQHVIGEVLNRQRIPGDQDEEVTP